MIQVKGISKSYGDKKVIDCIDLSLKDGDVAVIEGPSGCGKTTLARIIAQYESPDSGEIFIDGENILSFKGAEKRRRRHLVHLISQHPEASFDPDKSVFESISEGARYLKLCNKKDEMEYMERYIVQAGLDGVNLFKRPSALSGGELQRASLARALATRPRVLLCDEITSNLDRLIKKSIASSIRGISSEGMNIIYITHDHLEALMISELIYSMENGRLKLNR